MRNIFLKNFEENLSYLQNITEEEGLENFQTNVLRWLDVRVAEAENYINYMRRNNEDRERLIRNLINSSPLSKSMLSDLSKYKKYSGIDKAKNPAEHLQLRNEQAKNDIDQLLKLQTEMLDKKQLVRQQIVARIQELDKGLSPERVQQFSRFAADESHVGDQCVICMRDIEVGRNMMRLDCDGQHTFCQICIEGWFAEHNTCPICRHTF